MATGIEVAGLALAVFPLVMKGMENLIESAQTFKSWKKYRMVLAEYLQTIKDAKAFFIDTAEELLLDILETQDELDALRGDPAQVALANPRYEELLRKRLDHNYDGFLKTLTKMLAALDSVRKKLGLGHQADKVHIIRKVPRMGLTSWLSLQVLWDDYSTIEREFKRLKVVLSRRVYMQTLEEIDKANRKLRECTHQSRLLEPSRRKIRSSRTKVQSHKIRRHLKSLRHILDSVKAWNCDCQQYHATSLRLQAPSWGDSSNNGGQSQVQGIRVRVLLTAMSKSPEISQPWQWQELEFEPPDGLERYRTEDDSVPLGNDTPPRASFVQK
ncbi:MAG: hypothetical protein Q9218_007195 [Villophora microphyllina]